MINIRKSEAELWESADLLCAGSKLTSNQYCMSVEARNFAAKSAPFFDQNQLQNFAIGFLRIYERKFS